ncbi:MULTISPECIES: hypothetical protein [unclassified Acinetobacter]|uniref:hypothetical protein n=1 Tax=unclassified Acinetobacter TaxID=196816 RepID=UPI0021B809A1|nr:MULTISPECIES: hypothetical protein [unclassified Acinetobacter]MCT8089419.1 hypothetical protein [Acinetobacter sp. F_3_1]MCT8098213.1 hypothetical protein [Acinetobacter sp. C_3_1]MCT8101129.1 hypothetical protein [Acinetobacter sp. C_4_1]MCT8134880.1 hypothetical protein [Acinetobacter sp. T_3_1]
MQELQALIQGKITPQTIKIDKLIMLAERYSQPTSAEYKLLELAINIVLASYLEKAQKHL